MHIGTMVEFAFALVAKLDVINKHSFNDFKLRVGMYPRIFMSISWRRGRIQCQVPAVSSVSRTDQKGHEGK